jgi:hypothetical protein
MKVTMESTSKIVQLNGVPARIWEGTTETGIPCHVYVTRIAVAEGLQPEQYRDFEVELSETRKPSAEIEAIPLRMIL